MALLSIGYVADEKKSNFSDGSKQQYAINQSAFQAH